MSVLETIRKRAKWLVAIIGLSLGIFILEDLLTSGKYFWGGNDNTVAIINGKKVDNAKFNIEVENALQKEKVSMNSATLSDSDQAVTVQATFKNMVFKMILDPEYLKLGINVPDSELSDLMIGPDPAPDIYRLFSNGHGGLSKQFINPRTGGINNLMVMQYVKQMNDQQQIRWEMLEDKIKNETLQEKYFYLLINGYFIPDAMARQATEDETKTYDISYVLKRYSDVPDNSVTVSDQDLKDYYNTHLYEYSQKEESRKVDYVTFAINPSDIDMANIKRSVDTMYSQFKRLPEKEDSAFVVGTDASTFDYEYHKAGDLPVAVDSIMTHSEIGTMYGPYIEDGKYKIAKLLDIADLPDSCRYSQLFVPVQNSNDEDRVKLFIDSLKSIATLDNFADLAKTNSKDDESAQKGGDMGWIQRGGKADRFPDALEHQVFFGKVGNVIELPVQSGFVLLMVTDLSEKHTNYKVGIAVKDIEAGDSTRNAVDAIAGNFEVKNQSSVAFEKAAGEMNRRVVDVGENETTVAGFETPKDFIKWVYAAKEGDVSTVMSSGENKLVVAHVMQITKMGTMPLELVKEQVKLKVIDEKKAEKTIADMKGALSGGATLASVGQKVGSTVDTAVGLTFSSYSIPKLGKEDAVLGTMSALNTGTLSQPVQGELGVYVIKVDTTYYEKKEDFHMAQMMDRQAFQRGIPSEAYDALIKKAGLVSHLGKYY